MTPEPTQPISKLEGHLPLERTEKLKIFAILSMHQSVPKDIFESQKHNISLGLLITYTESEAVIGAAQTIRDMGLNPREYMMGVMRVSVNAEDVINMKPVAVAEPTKESKEVEAKSAEELMVKYARMLFNVAGNEKDNAVLERVVSKFMQQSQLKSPDTTKTP